jgi:hypothetical protein
MRASFEPSVLEIAFLVGWTAYGALRDRVGRIRARFADGPGSHSPEAEPFLPQSLASPVATAAGPRDVAPRVASVPLRRRTADYSIN